MLALVSPAKKLDFSDAARDLPVSQPQFLGESEQLVAAARKLGRADLKRLMKLSDALADLNFARFKAYRTPFTKANAKAAVLAFSGDTYIGLEAKSLSAADLEYAQGHLRILSGLYGLLRPLDLMQPYRLEMGSRLSTPRGADLYDFWGDKLARAIDTEVAGHKQKVVVNLASNEYFKAARAKSIAARIVTPVFKEVKDGEAKVLGMFAKRARGMMARFMIENRIEKADGLKDFNGGGYAYRDHLSDGDTFVFTRGR